MKKADIFQALRVKANFEVVEELESSNQLRIMGRISALGGPINMNNWLVLMYQLLSTMKQRPWKVDICKLYFLQPETDRMVFGWRVIFQGEALAKYYEEIVRTVTSAAGSSRTEVTEMPLAGGANRNSTEGGKRGAAPIGQGLVGPAAFQRRAHGG